MFFKARNFKGWYSSHFELLTKQIYLPILEQAIMNMNKSIRRLFCVI